MTSMTAIAETTIFWPCITSVITPTWRTCHQCNRMAPFQPNAPPFSPLPSAYPFPCISADFFHYKGKNHLVVVDRYSNWPIIEQAQAGSKGLFTTHIWNIWHPGLMCNGGWPDFTASPHHHIPIPKDWGVCHLLSSLAHPH